ncbi:UNVERIFIED_CONTAM: hypothetical protein H355_004179 [Colinus virginianus]|nr:hypothetical protein H355_004179 [Colinus virginianus]
MRNVCRTRLSWKWIVCMQVPNVWTDRGFLSMKSLSSWIQDLHARTAFIKRWIVEGIPVCFWLSALFCPQELCNSACVYTDWKRKTLQPQCFRLPVWTCVQGPSRPKVLFESLPVLWLQPVPDREPPTEGVYTCPIYKVPKRSGSLFTTGYSTNHVLNVEIPTPPSVEEDVFVKAGVAGVLSLQD